MRTRLTRLSVAVAVVFAVGALGAGTAQAAEPVVVGSCATTIQAAPGTPVSLSPGAVVQPVFDLVRAIPLLGPPLAEPFRKAFTALPPIPIGAIPTGSGVITGGEIADKVVAELNKIPLLGPILTTLTTGVRTTLTQLCGVTVTGVNAAVAPVQEGTKGLADASQEAVGQLPGVPGTKPTPNPGTPPPGTGQPGTPPGGTPGTGQPGGLPGGFAPVGGVGGLDLPLYGANPFSGNFGRVPLFSYGSLPFAMPGQFTPSPGVRYGGNVPGYRPGFGLPGADTDGVQTAGRAQALPGTGRMGGGVAAPVMLAVLLLSCVTGALVRTWVLRRATASP
ncbi:hypothetical protein ABZ816_13815 [Actinosynnema sp. NPDC047251]|uniref:TAF4A RNA polymerase II, TATA box binding protein (TBP)-associated factor n=1 Tax=Saccharothrix espanaensis (strain ATCC 51144 / DSM 44229 / JCM 9112 / NBRC 15066 / NRRL 15764) TaxID=1179773 RepID=K0KBV8_SACES|nr:TAF4A RNA polymerase II, TATA box-binding protein (TBP)-associated factor [Saccharothrix espanaensis]CCH35676.1 TAF4A RNA polymerase II, TATA box binding protein (TBP)-associated factor [Saccharothrix espanaensis DSM 44229]